MLALQAQAGDLKGVVQTKADLDGSLYSHSPEVHTAYVRWGSCTQVALLLLVKLLNGSHLPGSTCY